MKVSVITPTYNSERFILETYNSLVAQTFSNWEWIVTDDCSTDNTYNLLCKCAEHDSRIKLFRHNVNLGAAVSRNNSLDRVQGMFIAFLDSDDLWNPDKIEKQLKFMEDYNIDFSFTAYELIDEFSNLMNKSVDTTQLTPVDYYGMLKKEATMGCSTVMLRRNAFKEIKMLHLRTGQDYALWLNLLKQDKKAYPLNKILTRYRIVNNSISRNKFKKIMRQWQIYREIEQISLFSSMYYFFFYAWRAIFRKN